MTEPSGDTLHFHQTVSFERYGLPPLDFHDTLTGLPQEQLLRQASRSNERDLGLMLYSKEIALVRPTHRASQRGRAIGRNAYPQVPEPLWPNAEIEPARHIIRRSPRLVDGKPTEFSVEWSYEFESEGDYQARLRDD